MRSALVLSMLLPAAVAASSDSAISFEANAGQTDPTVRYLARTGGGTILFTDRGVVLPGRERAVTFELAGESAAARWDPEGATGRTTSYRIGRDRSRWIEGVPSYRQLIRRGVYPGIDLVYYGSAGRLEYDFRLAPHSDPSAIRLRFPGARRISIDGDGALLVETSEGVVRHERPAVFERAGDGSERRVEAAYRLIGRKQAAFRVGEHDPALALSIDPVLDSSSFFGGSGDDSVIFANSTIIVGNTSSIDFPGAAFARRKGTNIFVQIFNQVLIYGATGNVVATCASAPNYASAYAFVTVGGYTDAPDLPTTSTTNTNFSSSAAAWQPDFAGGATDGFLLVLYLSGNNVSSFLSYIGTSGDDRVTAISNNGSYILLAGTTTGRGLPFNAAPTYQGVPSDSAAGIDGFILTIGSGLPYSETLLTTTYFGGSGDDTPTAALITTLGYYIAGETTSPDFSIANGLPNTLNGGSDAFLMRLTPTGLPAITPAAILFGGSGTDRATALSAFGTSVLVAGNTASQDLPVQNAAQATYGGGASDAFLAMFSADLTALTYATYIGGSSAEQATAVNNDSATSIFVGGYTSSQDFPLQSPSQPQYGGGPDDAFLVHYDLSGNLQDSTYFGGSGSDHILGVFAPGGSNVLVCGQTTSGDLPAQNATQLSLKGTSDGFIAHLSSNGYSSAPALGAKDLRSYVSFSIGAAAQAASPVTISSSDPSTVQLAANLTDAGQPSIQLATSGTSGNYYLDCLADHGGADITFSAPNVPSSMVHASCYPAAVSVSYIGTSTYVGATTAATVALPAGRQSTFNLSPTINAPPGIFATWYLPGIRPGTALPQVQIALSNPSVGTLSTSSLTFIQSDYGGLSAQFTLTPTAPGQAQMLFSSPTLAFPNNSPLNLNVTAVGGLAASYSVASGFQRFIGLTYSPMDSKQPLTVTSQDPSSILVAADCSQPGSASATVPSAASALFGFCIQAIAASGDTTITLTAPNEQPVTSAVHITSPTLWFPYLSLAQPVALTAGQSTSVTAAIGGADSISSCCFIPNPGSSVTLSLLSSNPQAIAAPAPVAVTSNTAYFNVKAAGTGNAVLTIQPPPGFAASPLTRSVAVTVKNKPIAMADLEVGNNLAGRMTVTLPGPATGTVSIHVTIANSSLALLSSDTQSAGQTQLDLTLSSGFSAAGFYVYGLAASGQTQVTATATGLGSITANVILEPSGFGWAADSYSATLYSQATLPSIYAYVLDPATSLPVGQQVLRPGITATISISNSNSGAASLSASTYTVPPGTLPRLTLQATGNVNLTLSTPAGFSTPSIRQNLPVTIQSPTFQVSSFLIGRNLQGAAQFNFNFTLNPPGTLPLTLTSSDPSRLLISADPTQPGTASATVAYSDRSKLTLQALDDHGAVTITASIPTFADSSVNIPLYPTGIGLGISNQYVSSALAPYSTTTQSPSTAIIPVVFVIAGTPQVANLGLRAGLGPVQVGISSSSTSVGTISNSPVTLNAAQYGQQSSVTFTPVAAGQTTVSVAEPAGFVDVPGFSSETINVTAPTFGPAYFVMGKDTAIQIGAGLSNNVAAPTANVAVTLTSADPSRLLLSPDANTSPTASITEPLIAGRTTTPSFYIHAIANNGIVPINISAPGYAAGAINIALGDLAFAFNVFQTPMQVILQNGPQTVNVIPSIIWPQGLPTNLNYGAQSPVIRPGASITVTVTSSDPSTVAIDAPQVVFTGGASTMPVQIRPVQPGTATLSLSYSAGYVAPLNNATLPVTVSGAQLGFTNSAMTVGRDLQAFVNVSVQGTGRPAGITVTSADPSRVLLAADYKTPGQASVTIVPGASGYAALYIQSLSDNGTVNITASAPGYQSGTLPVILSPSAAVFSGAYPGTTQVNWFTNSGVQQQPVALSPLDPLTLQPRGTLTPRPGANLSVSVTSSNPAIVQVNSATVSFAVGDPGAPPAYTVPLQPLSVGTAILTLGLLPGGAAPASNGSLVVNVAEPSLNLASFTIGRDLVAPTQIMLGSAVPTPTSDLAISVDSNYPIALSNTATGFGNYILTATIPAGQRISQPFYVQGMQPGTANLSLFGGGYNSQATGTVTQTAFVFKEALQSQTVTIANGSTTTLTIVPVLSPVGTVGLSPLAIRNLSSSPTIFVSSNNTKVATTSFAEIAPGAGTQQMALTINALAPGSAIISLSGPTYDFSAPQSQIIVTVK